MTPPPDAFLHKMASLLGEEYPAFAASYAADGRRGLRVNTLKLTPADFSSKSPFALTAVGPYEPAGFLISDEAQAGRHPYHAAGLYYLQEPSAMVVAALLRPQPGDWVLDLAAAPGGKTTHLAALMDDTGLLVANDVHTGRARILAENLERWGARNVLVTNNEPAQLAARFGPVFDKVLVDAPCSGEGMFRKQGGFAWSEEMVLACSRRQSAILDTAVALVRPGGRLAYTTCTFSPEEDEQVIARFLDSHPAFTLVDPPVFTGFQPGRPAWADGRSALSRTIRLWPHHFPGEGHFIALLQRDHDTAPANPPILPPAPGRQAPGVLAPWRDFARDTLRLALDEERLQVVNGRYLQLLPPDTIDPAGLRVIRHGLPLGEIRPARRGPALFKPAHALALSLRAADAAYTLDFPPDDPALHAYLAGHPLAPASPLPDSVAWLLITVDGHPLGWGKSVQGQVKNHYPRGLRL